MKTVVLALFALTSVALAEAPPNNGKPWTPAQEQTLRDGLANGENIQQIAAELGRYPSAVKARIEKLGLASNTGIKEPVAANTPAARSEPPVPAPSQPQLPLPPKTSISVKETPSAIPAPTPRPGSKCKLAHKLITFTPTIRLGADAQGGEVVWRFYAGVRNPEGRGIKLVSEKTLVPGDPFTVAPIVASAGEWQCSCCRFLNRETPRLFGWYAQITKDSKVIAEAKPMTGSTEMAKLMETKPEVPKSREDGMLQFTTQSK